MTNDRGECHGELPQKIITKRNGGLDCTLDMKDVMVSGLYLALISKSGGVRFRYFLSTKLGLKLSGQ